MFDLYNYFGKMKPKTKKHIRNRSYYDYMVNIFIEMFDYKNLPSTIDKPYLEELLLHTGRAMITIFNGDLIVCECTDGGNLDIYGHSTNFHGVTRNGHTFDRTNGKDCIIIYNNSTRSCELNLWRYCDIFSEVDASQLANVKNSRQFPIYIVNNDKDKATIDKILDDREETKTSTIIANTKLLDEENEPIRTVSLTDTTQIDKLQYLSTFHNDLLRRIFFINGQPFALSMKQAQQTQDEINSTVTASMIYPYNKLHEREQALNQINKLFNTNITVEFSTPWKITENKMTETVTPYTTSEKGVDVL